MFYGATAAAQNVVYAEYFVDTDAGVGNNTLITLANPLPDGSYNFNIALTNVPVGYHKVYIRTKDSDGNWSIVARRHVEVISSDINKRIVSGEYFFDTDPGFEAASVITVTPQDSAILQNFTAATGALSIGYHKLYTRFKDNDGNWSLTSRRNVEVFNNGIYTIAGVEYFFNTDPGAGSATPITFGTPMEDGSFSFHIPIENVPTGAHTLYLRARDSSNNNWSITQWQKDSVVTSVQSGKWSQPATWSNNKIPDSNTVVLLYHNVDVDITDAICKSLTPYRNNVVCIIEAGKALTITGHR